MSRRQHPSRELVDALASLDLFWTDDGRVGLLGELQTHGLRLDVAVSGTRRAFAEGLAEACLTKSGALHALVDVLSWKTHDAEPVREIRRLVGDLLPGQWFRTVAERAEYLRLLEQVLSPVRLPRYYRIATSADHPEPMTTVDELLRAVEVLPNREPAAPLLVLAELAEREPVKPRLTKLARKWSDRLAERMGAAADLAALRLIPLTRAAGPPPSLMIQLVPLGHRHDRYHLTAWLYADGAEQLSTVREPIVLDELGPAVQALLPQALARAIARGATELAVEFILPRELLGHAVEDYLIDLKSPHRTLKIEYPVVVRDLQRQRDPTVFLQWRRKWAALQDSGMSHDSVFTWIGGDADVSDRFYRRMLADDRIALGVAGAVGPWLPLALDAGLPLVVWRRCGEDTGLRFRSAFTGVRPHQLPQTALRLRKDADGPDDPGTGLVVLLDDPDRRPDPDFHLAIPPATEDTP